ncbi:LacI family transcriptional regulator [Muricomes intestini]|jgi:LacI family transcriptional regulator|uniref:LacI family transcriptional regulator n=1 Tax=Muricomes intestini TaxID=1796634 RepID=A0A4R3K3W8_9FIRM|nr:LacI family DNA-binding transcriptional regulator [Muricomes intestini]TCS77434.1 LacI family transcriptional regulator [Muricomes intestini]
MPKEFTINDIAREAGVSKATVSRVLNESASVKPETKERILNIMEERNFSPSAAARDLSRRQSNTIGVIVPEVDNPFFGDILRGITEIADQSNYMMICCNSDDSAKKDKKALLMLKEHRVRGLLYTPAVDYTTKEQQVSINKLLKDLNAPIVIMDRQMDSMEEYDGVFFDDEKAMYEATKELIHAGHTEIGLLNAAMDRVLARGRYRGYERAMNEAGLSVNKGYVFEGDYHMAKAYNLSKELLAMENRPTAVLTCNNRTSLGFLKALYERGERLSKDIACIGLDRIEVFDIINNNFNYIERDGNQMGHCAMDLLNDRIVCPQKPLKQIILTPVLRIHDL